MGAGGPGDGVGGEHALQVGDGTGAASGPHLVRQAPQVLGGLEFGAVGRQRDQFDARGAVRFRLEVPFRATDAQRAFAEFLRISPDLIAAAAERSAASEEADAAAPRGWIISLPAGWATDLPARAAAGEGTRLRAHGFRDARGGEAEPEPRTVPELPSLAEIHEARRFRREREEEARERARREREEAAGRQRRLAARSRGGAAWRR